MISEDQTDERRRTTWMVLKSQQHSQTVGASLQLWGTMFSLKHTGSHHATHWVFSLFTFQSAVVWSVINHVSISTQKAPDTLIIPYSCVFSHNNLALSCKDSPACDLCVWVLERERRKASRNTATPLLMLWHVFCFLQSFILVSMLYLFISSFCFPHCVCQSRRPYIALY